MHNIINIKILQLTKLQHCRIVEELKVKRYRQTTPRFIIREEGTGSLDRIRIYVTAANDCSSNSNSHHVNKSCISDNFGNLYKNLL